VPPVDEIVYPVSTVLTVLFSEDDESVKAGAARASTTVNVKVLEADPVGLVAVIVYVVALATEVGVPEIKPVEVLNVSPGVFEIAGLIS
jgi:hypothetical protein